MPTTVPEVTTGDVIVESWGDAVQTAIEELQATPPNHGSRHQPGGADALPTAAAGASAVGDTAATGTSTSLSRADHRHSREAFGAVGGANGPGSTASDGTATTVSHSDHRHARNDTFGGVNPSGGSAGSAGASGNVNHADHIHALLGGDVAIAAGSTGALASGADVNVTMTWASVFGSTPSYGFVSAELNADCTAPTLYVKSMTTTQIIVRVHNNDASSRTFSLRALGIK